LNARIGLAAILLASAAFSQNQPAQTEAAQPQRVFGYKDFSAQAETLKRFFAVPDPKQAEEDLRTLTAVPHIAGSPEDKKTADFVAEKFRAAGLDTQIVEYKVWMNYPKHISVDVTAPAGVKMHGPTREHIDAPEAYQNDPRVVTPFNGYSPSGVAEADVVYANYGRLEDFKKLKEMGIDVRGKIAIVRYGQNFRGVKAYVAQENGCAGVIIYSDPIDDGYFKGDMYSKGPWRPWFGVQRGSIGYMFEFPGDPTTPGVASTPDLPDAKRIDPKTSAALSTVPTTPISYGDAQPILQNLGGPASPREWQGALPFTYHVGPGPVRVKLDLQQDYAYRTIWDVIGKIPGSESPEQWVVAGNHRDAWVYGAVDPNSGTASMLEAVRGMGELLKSGWKPKRTIVIGSWDAEEEGLIGSTEWGEQNADALANGVAYFNMDVAVSGPNFGASSVPALKEFVKDVTRLVPAAKGNTTVYETWKDQQPGAQNSPGTARETKEEQKEVTPGLNRESHAKLDKDVTVGDLGSGSDYTVFLQRLGVPSTDVGSNGAYGVYHSVFDDFAWFKAFGDPEFLYEQEMARIFGTQVLNMADADVLPYDYKTYGEAIEKYIATAEGKAKQKWPTKAPDFSAATQAAKRLTAAGTAMLDRQNSGVANAELNKQLVSVERALLIPEGLPNRHWYRHAIYAPGVYTGYAAVVIPGVNEAIDAGDAQRTTQQLASLTAALGRASAALEAAAK
jgi:N-acetylated-alpha-linked acidic dipeptidase